MGIRKDFEFSPEQQQRIRDENNQTDAELLKVVAERETLRERLKVCT